VNPLAEISLVLVADPCTTATMRPLLFLLLLFLPLMAKAADPAALCESAVHAAETAARLPPHLLSAMARVEAGRPDPVSGALRPWPWTINAEGEGFFFRTRAQATAAVRGLQAKGIRSIDVGCMQVNLMHHPDAFASLEQAFDPAANARYAARFLTTLHAGRQDWMQAVAAYHSQTPAYGAAYRRRVQSLWRHPALSAASLSLAAKYRAFIPPSRVYGDFIPQSRRYGAFASSTQTPASPHPGR
jgi:hypothetical protein